MKLVNEGGYLVTASCSYHMRPDLFLETIQDAAKDAGKILRLVEWRAAGKDHPQILRVDEGHYLKFAVFEVRSKSETLKCSSTVEAKDLAMVGEPRGRVLLYTRNNLEWE